MKTSINHPAAQKHTHKNQLNEKKIKIKLNLSFQACLYKKLTIIDHLLNGTC